MANINELANLDDFRRRYEAGEPIRKLAMEIGTRPVNFYKWLQRHGVKIRPKKIPIPQSIRDRYLAGESENSLAKAMGVNRWVIRHNLIENGICPRGQSEAELIRWASMTKAQRAAQVAAAHAATRGCSIPLARKIKAAMNRQVSPVANVSPTERALADMLEQRGFVITPQKALGPYNLDIAIDALSVAVEVYGGGWHSVGKHAATHPERCKHILDSGWDVIIVWVDRRRNPLTIGGAEYIAAHLESVRGLPTGRRQYRVINGDGELAPIRKSRFNTPAFVMGLGGRLELPRQDDHIAG